MISLIPSIKSMMSIITLLMIFACTTCHAKHVTFLETFRDLFVDPLVRAAPPRTTPKKVDNNCVCGQLSSAREEDTKVINGVEVNPKYKYPWMVLLKKEGMFSCGGSLINDKFVLTAGHCVENRDVKVYEVVMGIHNISLAGHTNPTNLANEPFAIKRAITHIKVFSLYDGVPIPRYDIALLKLATPVKYTKQISPVCLPAFQQIYNQPAMDSIIMGWGVTETGFTSEVLKEATVKVYGSDECRKTSMYDATEIGDENVCASADGKDTCQGDSGGPLVIKGTTAYTQLGIVSWGNDCALKGFPGVYTSVPTFVNYIYSVTRGGIYCRNPNLGQ